ncbi:hypothetical protein F511_12444 [Dorcoceras hygrometricum]|uniref:Uncharacterized protein n=1 Tax=Dorcoceras hygrometricum TaxID=472368 RepID=A0A2Z7DKR7_9LAMI|nr:hypothetical protein F511_12444 [Dorcoceras hygrometricum]
MPPRRRGRGIGQFQQESEGQNDEDQRSIPSHRRTRQVEDEVDELAARVDDMEIVMARFQRMNPQTFNVTLAMSLFDLQDVCIAIGSLATLDLPMVVDLIGIYGLKGPYCTLTKTNWFLQALSVIPRGSWGDVSRRSYHDPMGKSGIVIPEPQCVFLLRIGERQRFDKLERRRGVHCFVSAEEVFSRYFVEIVQQLLSLFVEDCDTTAFDLVGTTAFGLIQQKHFFVNQQMLYLVFTSRCISKIAKRRHLIKLTRHRFIAKGISRWKNAYAYQQMNSSKRFSSRSL